jgi:hypothetical protein
MLEDSGPTYTEPNYNWTHIIHHLSTPILKPLKKKRNKTQLQTNK